MYDACDDNVDSLISRKICKANAKTFYLLVHTAGQRAWNSAQKTHCDCK